VAEGAATPTRVEHRLAFGDDFSEVRLFPLFAHLWQIVFLHLLPLLLLLLLGLGGGLLVGVVVGVHLYQYDETVYFFTRTKTLQKTC